MHKKYEKLDLSKEKMQNIEEYIIEAHNFKLCDNYSKLANIVNNYFNLNYYNKERIRNVIRKHKKLLQTKTQLEETVDNFREIIIKNAYIKQQEEINNNRILCISDLHIPFHLDITYLNDYANKVDILVINGDEQDCQGISKYPKKYRNNFVEELVTTRQVIIDIIKLVKPKKTIINYGNHNIRFINYLSSKLHEDLLQLMPKTNLDLIVNSGFYNYNHENDTQVFYEPISKIYNVEYTNNWYCQVGKTIFCHPSAYGSGILKTTEKAYLYFLQTNTQFDCIVMAHTHQLGMYKYGSAWLIESGCLCKGMDYISGRLTRPQQQGFVYIVQDANGKYIYEESKLIQV